MSFSYILNNSRRILNTYTHRSSLLVYVLSSLCQSLHSCHLNFTPPLSQALSLLSSALVPPHKIADFIVIYQQVDTCQLEHSYSATAIRYYNRSSRFHCRDGLSPMLVRHLVSLLRCLDSPYRRHPSRSNRNTPFGAPLFSLRSTSFYRQAAHFIHHLFLADSKGSISHSLGLLSSQCLSFLSASYNSSTLRSLHTFRHWTFFESPSEHLQSQSKLLLSILTYTHSSLCQSLHSCHLNFTPPLSQALSLLSSALTIMLHIK